jgi:hypothetical protein
MVKVTKLFRFLMCFINVYIQFRIRIRKLELLIWIRQKVSQHWQQVSKVSKKIYIRCCGSSMGTYYAVPAPCGSDSLRFRLPAVPAPCVCGLIQHANICEMKKYLKPVLNNAFFCFTYI